MKLEWLPMYKQGSYCVWESLQGEYKIYRWFADDIGHKIGQYAVYYNDNLLHDQRPRESLLEAKRICKQHAEKLRINEHTRQLREQHGVY